MLHDYNQHFTPQEILEDIKDILTVDLSGKNIKAIADLMAGQGALLNIAEQVLSPDRIFSNDIDISLCNSMSELYPHWEVYNFDAMDRENFIDLRSSIDLILINPPFSRDSKRDFSFEINNEKIRCSYSLLHLLNVISYLRPGGDLIAILPASVPYSDRDVHAWKYLNEIFDIKVSKEYSGGIFKECYAATILVVMENLHLSKPISHLLLPREQCLPSKIRVTRGWKPMHEVDPSSSEGDILLHTTSIKNNQIVKNYYANSRRLIHGPSLIFPRVGRPDPRKIVLFENSKSYIISDCLISIQSDEGILDNIGKFMMADENFHAIYSGTGAKYTSMNRVIEYISLILKELYDEI